MRRYSPTHDLDTMAVLRGGHCRLREDPRDTAEPAAMHKVQPACADDPALMEQTR